MPISTLRGSWKRLLTEDRLQRSSHALSIIDDNACIFGGEVQPRQPVDNHVDIVSLSAAPKFETKSPSPAPSARVGSPSAALNCRMYLFSGRGGAHMAPIDEAGAVWCFHAATSSWSCIRPADSSKPCPPARSYHCATSDGTSNIYIHAGCPEKGRLSDLWRFEVNARTWTQLAGAPGPERGGASIAYCKGKLYRMHGFDGSKEQGGSVDSYDIATDMWSTHTFGNDGPRARSVCALLPVRLGLPRKDKLLTLFGERDPSAEGHAGAGKMLSDVWIYDISEKWWTELHPRGSDGVPEPRGWFGADVVGSARGDDSVVMHGGLGENNERLADVWVLSF